MAANGFLHTLIFCWHCVCSQGSRKYAASFVSFKCICGETEQSRGYHWCTGNAAFLKSRSEASREAFDVAFSANWTESALAVPWGCGFWKCMGQRRQASIKSCRGKFMRSFSALQIWLLGPRWKTWMAAVGWLMFRRSQISFVNHKGPNLPRIWRGGKSFCGNSSKNPTLYKYSTFSGKSKKVFKNSSPSPLW